MPTIKSRYPFNVNKDIEKGDIVEFYVKSIGDDSLVSTNGVRAFIYQGERFEVLSVYKLQSGNLFTLVAVNCVSGESPEIIQVTSNIMCGAKIYKKVQKQVKLHLAPKLQPYLIEALQEAAEKGTYVEVNQLHRGIGKTTAVIQYAKKNGITAIVSNRSDIELLKEENDYEFIITPSRLPRLTEANFVYDEGVDLEIIKRDLILGKKFNFVTGFKRTQY